MLVTVLAFAMMKQKVSVCDIRKKPSAYLKRLETIHAQIVLAGPEGAYLLDKNCPNNILILGYDLPDAEQSATNLIPSVVSDCSPDSPNHKTHGDFTGGLSIRQEAYPNSV